jgi:hypothetical protein
MKKYAILDKVKPHTKQYKRLKFGGGHLYDRSSVLDCHGSANYY